MCGIKKAIAISFTHLSIMSPTVLKEANAGATDCLSIPDAYISHNTTYSLSEIIGGNLSD